MSERAVVLDHITISPRFSRAVTLADDDARFNSLDGYVPTARALEVLRRFAAGVERQRASRAFSVIGPYGSGKSSFAVFLSALLGASTGAEATTTVMAQDLLQTVAPELRELWGRTVQPVAGRQGWVQAIATAPQREPVSTTVLRALVKGAGHPRIDVRLRRSAERLLKRAEDLNAVSPSTEEVLDLVVAMASSHPVVLMLDEFGKNLEAYADRAAEADLYLLQRLAETAANRPDGIMLVVLTIQHLAFESYAEAATTALRREWAKVQGRFEDVSFVDTGAGIPQLIGRVLRHTPRLGELIDADVQRVADMSSRLALPVADRETIASCYPLHPVAISVLPDLCSRFGQNQRTLFSFLASAEVLAVPSLIAKMPLPGKGRPAGWVRLDAVYDYFVESVSTLVGASRDATRWAEVVTAVRDAVSLDEAERIVLKTIAVMNLVAAYGHLRASSRVLSFAVQGSHPDLMEEEQALKAIASLERSGVVVFRDFADEYRIWRGSDFDLAEALAVERGKLRETSLAPMLARIHPLRAVVAGRHSVETLTVRALSRRWLDEVVLRQLVEELRAPVPHDGTILYATDGIIPDALVDAAASTAFPVLTVIPHDTAGVREAAVEVQALVHVRDSEDLPREDLAVRKEIDERLDYARQVLRRAVDDAFGDRASWRWINPVQEGRAKPPGRDLSDVVTTAEISAVLTEAYSLSPTVRYEALNRHELTSQGARIRSTVMGAVMRPERRDQPNLGFVEGSAEATAAFALFEEPAFDWVRGVYAHPPEFGECGCRSKREHTGRVNWIACWNGLESWLAERGHQPTPVSDLLLHLASPPFGLRSGVAAVMLGTALVLRADEYMLFEHQSFVRDLDPGVLERMARNPRDFAVAAPRVDGSPKLSGALRALDAALTAHDVPAGRGATVVGLAARIARVLQVRSDKFTTTSRLFERALGTEVSEAELQRTIAVREAIMQARDPYRLVFEDLARAVGMEPLVPGHGGTAGSSIETWARLVATAVSRLWQASDRLAAYAAQRVAQAATGTAKITPVIESADRLGTAEGVVLSAAVRQFVMHSRELGRKLGDALDEEASQAAIRSWIRALATNLTGQPLDAWRDPDIPSLTAGLESVATEFKQHSDLAMVNQGIDEAFSLRAIGKGGVATDSVVRLPAAIAQKAEDIVKEALARLRKVVPGGEGELEALLAAALRLAASSAEDSDGVHRGN